MTDNANESGADGVNTEIVDRSGFIEAIGEGAYVSPIQVVVFGKSGIVLARMDTFIWGIAASLIESLSQDGHVEVYLNTPLMEAW